MYYTNHLPLSPLSAQRLRSDQKRGASSTLVELKNMAQTCLGVQFATLFIHFCSSIFSPKSHEVAVLCGVIAIIASLVPVFYAWYKRQFQLLFSCISVFNMAPIWFLYLEAVLPGYDAFEYSAPVYRMEAFFWISIFMIFINLFYLLFRTYGIRLSSHTFSFLNEISIKPVYYSWFTIIAFVIPLLGFYVYFGSADKLWIWLTAGRSDAAKELLESVSGKRGMLMEPCKWLFQLAPVFGAIAIASAKRRGLLPILSLVLSLLVVFFFFLGGSRGTMMFVAAPLLFFFFYYNWHRGLKFWIPAILMLFMLIGVMEFQVRFRSNLLEVIANPEKAVRDSEVKSLTTFDPSKSHRDNNTYLLCLMIKGYPDKYAFDGLNGLMATLVNPIPRAIWPGKPILGGAKDMSQQMQFILDGPLHMGTTSLTYSVVGEAYLQYGLLALLIYAAIYSVFLLFFDGILLYTANKQPLAAGMLGVGVFLSFWGFRSFFALVSFMYPIVLLIITIKLARLVIKSI